MKKIIAALAGLVVLASAYVVAETIEDRIKPVGEVCMAGDACAAAVVASASSSEPRSGSDVYTAKCAMCHASGAAGAPKMGDAGGWTARIAKGNDSLYTNAISGFNGMPAKGLCFDCSDDEIKAAVDHMVAGSQ